MGERKLLIVFFLVVLSVTGCQKLKVEREFYDNGQIKAERHIQGQDEEFFVYLPNGQLIGEYHYRRGKRHGVSKIYNNDGELYQELIYRRGELIKQQDF